MSTAQKIAAELGETEHTPIKTIERIVKVLGEERALALLDETLKIEADGGMLTEDGSQRRTPGGVFFRLVKAGTTGQERGLIFLPKQQPAAPKAKPQPLNPEEWLAVSNEALKLTKGEISKVKITVIGRPGRVIEKGEVVITSMENTKVPSLPSGLPAPPSEPTTYLVYIAQKQWRKVKDSLNQNADDKLIVEGYPVLDKRIGQGGTLTVYAHNTTTKLLDQAKREQQKAAPPK
ncbi:MAG: hypothetical protein HC875_29690 [Anaerolineales bacterium]|nr:hypothetical protein [Anaerolineales bacterium]